MLLTVVSLHVNIQTVILWILVWRCATSALGEPLHFTEAVTSFYNSPRVIKSQPRVVFHQVCNCEWVVQMCVWVPPRRCSCVVSADVVCGRGGRAAGRSAGGCEGRWKSWLDCCGPQRTTGRRKRKDRYCRTCTWHETSHVGHHCEWEQNLQHLFVKRVCYVSVAFRSERKTKNSVWAFTSFILSPVCVFYVQYVFWGLYCLNRTLTNSWTWCQTGSLHTCDPPCPGDQSWSPSPAAAPAECLRTCWGKQPGLCCVGSAQSSWHRAAPSGSCVWHSCCWWTSGRLPGDINNHKFTLKGVNSVLPCFGYGSVRMCHSVREQTRVSVSVRTDSVTQCRTEFVMTSFIHVFVLNKSVLML